MSPKEIGEEEKARFSTLILIPKLSKRVWKFLETAQTMKWKRRMTMRCD
jgi:hypothetical protein